ncbi:hypothetical protein M011DRAFT_466779 [Sporormia fimetaria CBS 119925]|uniref:Uncharacterized protein n=1 Tax=Sporormia fimetaria CBS 119925 TaxID=1340428 RepID=A0A6A6VDT9_9PLEO|nr:hypothetical protein M011DRAFT_466779 [Sporormia fimetaria CBS 119925]
MEFYRRSHGNALKGYEYLRAFKKLWIVVLVVVHPRKFMLQIERVTEKRWWRTRRMVVGLLLWAVAVPVSILMGSLLFPLSLIFWLIEDEVWEDTTMDVGMHYYIMRP